MNADERRWLSRTMMRMGESFRGCVRSLPQVIALNSHLRSSALICGFIALALSCEAAEEAKPGAAHARVPEAEAPRAAPALEAPVEDPYRFLEDLADPESQAFFREQAAQARARLDRIPGRAAILARIHALSDSSVTISAIKVTNGARVFYLKLAPGRMA